MHGQDQLGQGLPRRHRFLGAIGEMNMGMAPRSLVLTGLVWGLVELVIATIVGAWLYKEG